MFSHPPCNRDNVFAVCEVPEKMGNARREIRAAPARKANSERVHHSSAPYQPPGHLAEGILLAQGLQRQKQLDIDVGKAAQPHSTPQGVAVPPRAHGHQ